MTIVARDVEYRYPSGVQALAGVSLEIAAGTTAIIGQNGAGKTTLIKHFNGLLSPSAGQVLVDGRSTVEQGVARLAHVVGLVFQNPNDQIFNRTVWHEAAFGPQNLGFSPQRVRELVQRSLELVGLAQRASEHPYELPASERKLLCIAAVLAMDTPTVLLDEPTTAQDHGGVRRIGELVSRLRLEGKTVVAITHDMELVASAFERTMVMAKGRILLDGPTREVFGRADVLAQSFVQPPPITRLARRLGLPGTVLSIDEFCELLHESQRGQRPGSPAAR